MLEFGCRSLAAFSQINFTDDCFNVQARALDEKNQRDLKTHREQEERHVSIYIGDKILCIYLQLSY